MRDDVIKMLNRGMKPKEISAELGINYNTVRQISTANNFVNSCQEHLSGSLLEKLKELGNNVRALSTLKGDYDSIELVLEEVEIGVTTRAQLEVLVKNIEQINERKQGITDKTSLEIEEFKEGIEQQKKEIAFYEIELKEKLQKNMKLIEDLKSKNKKAYEGFLNLIAIHCDSWHEYSFVVSKKLEMTTWKRMLKEEILEYDKFRYVTYIRNMEAFIKRMTRLMKQNDYFENTPSAATGYSRSNTYYLLSEYRTLRKFINARTKFHVDRIAKYEADIKKAEEKLNASNKIAINEYFSEKEHRDKQSSVDMITHAKIGQGGARWLYNQGYVSTVELAKDSYFFDGAAYHPDTNEIVILESKATVEDLKQDKKLVKYAQYCDKLYIVSNNYSVLCEAMNLHPHAGVIELKSNFTFFKLWRESKNFGNGDLDLINRINRRNSSLLIKGFE